MFTHRCIVGDGISDGLLLCEDGGREQHAVDALDHTVAGQDVVAGADRALHAAAGAAVAAPAGALAEAALPLSCQGGDHKGEVALAKGALLCAGEVVACLEKETGRRDKKKGGATLM